MIAIGLIEEVVQIKKRWDLSLEMTSMRCVGYRQVWEYLEGKYDEQTLIEKGSAATRQLAKRQLTWLRSFPIKHVLDPYSESTRPEILRLVKTLIS
jgi:tRNA dimethylallyltransferase